jgi:hypothetical protein
MKFSRTYRDALFILAMSCAALYELGPLADIHESKLEFETTLKRELWPLIGIINISQLKLMSSTPKQQ